MQPLILVLLIVAIQSVSGGRHKKDGVKKHDTATFDPTAGTYPNPDFTPGSIFPDITVKELCKGGYARKARKVPMELKRQVRALYGVDADDTNYSIDHFIPLSLGGTNDISNLWPQKASGIMFGSQQKAQSDYFLYREVCEGRMELRVAQGKVMDNWVKIFRECCSDIARRHAPTITIDDIVAVATMHVLYTE